MFDICLYCLCLIVSRTVIDAICKRDRVIMVLLSVSFLLYIWEQQSLTVSGNLER